MNTKTINCYRHGDLVLKQIDKLPKGLKKENTKVLMTGSNNNPHSIDNGIVYFKKVDDFVFGYLVAKDTKLQHKEHGKGKGEIKIAKINDGIYELRRQVEFTPVGLIPVKD